MRETQKKEQKSEYRMMEMNRMAYFVVSLGFVSFINYVRCLREWLVKIYFLFYFPLSCMFISISTLINLGFYFFLFIFTAVIWPWLNVFNSLRCRTIIKMLVVIIPKITFTNYVHITYSLFWNVLNPVWPIYTFILTNCYYCCVYLCEHCKNTNI